MGENTESVRKWLLGADPRMDGWAGKWVGKQTEAAGPDLHLWLALRNVIQQQKPTGLKGAGAVLFPPEAKDYNPSAKEKRRLQEEQDKARREKEDERLRQQQLKRKSLRDQWLMEGSPLSPSSPNTQNTFSSLWGTEDTDMEKHTDKLQSEDQQVTAQRDHGTEAVKVAETRGENIHVVLENGETSALGSGPLAGLPGPETAICL
ncbi:hypothetical protein CRENBAI_002796 [Crenichthys baileyi]|uniref:Uncharacterized protein n=1 Tax=Crenichthys baileyi TaxID=28760 RepID=A0AAV9SG52_9TELE